MNLFAAFVVYIVQKEDCTLFCIPGDDALLLCIFDSAARIWYDTVQVRAESRFNNRDDVRVDYIPKVSCKRRPQGKGVIGDLSPVLNGDSGLTHERK